MKFFRFLRVPVFLSVRSLWRGNLGITLMTITMLSMIYINLLFIPSLIQGLVYQVNNQLINTMTGNLMISSSKSGMTIADRDKFLDDVRSNPDVVGATGTYRVGTEVSHGDLSNVWTIESINPNSFHKVFSIPDNIIEGKYLDANDTDSILLGIGIAGAGQKGLTNYSSSLKNVHSGDVVTVSLINGTKHDFTVKGIYKNTFMFSDNRAYITNAAAEKLIPPSANHSSSVYVKAADNVNEVKLGDKLITLKSDLKYQTSDEMGAGIKEQIKAFDIILRILKAFSLLVAAITVFIVTYVELINRRKQIGIERAIGIHPSAIIWVYLIKSLFFAMIGILVGAAIFAFVVVPYFTSHPFDFPYGPVKLFVNQSEMTSDAIILLVVSLISALIPAIQSVRIKILDAIWGVN